MNSPFAQLFLALQVHIKSTVTSISYVAQDTGQLAVKGRPPVTFPCVLIDIDKFSFSNLGEGVQTANGEVLLKLGFAPISPTAHNTPNEYKEMAINYYDLEWALHKALHGWCANDSFGSMIRVSADTQCRTDGYRVREIRYGVTFDDYSTRTEQIYAPATLQLTLSE